jgi:hypothetical protein
MAILFFKEAPGASIAFLPVFAVAVAGSLAFGRPRVQHFNQIHTSAVALSR